MMLLVLLLIFPTLDAHSNSFVSLLVLLLIFPNLDSQLVNSLGQAVDTNELE
jgi:hypothetical protein